MTENIEQSIDFKLTEVEEKPYKNSDLFVTKLNISPSKKENQKEYDRIRHLINRERDKALHKIWYSENHEQILVNLKQNRREIFLETIAQYSGDTNKCAWEGCNEDRVDGLEIDHINSGGTKHRESIGNFYAWAKKNNFPNKELYQVLCGNHQTEKTIVKNEYHIIQNPTQKQLIKREYHQRYNDKLRWETLSTYSNSSIPYCNVCGTTYFWHLCLGRIEGNCYDDVEKYGCKGGITLYEKLRKMGFPDKDNYQTICHTCNLIKMREYRKNFSI